MEVILKEDVKNLGKAGDVVKVSEGYARNFLFPTNKAIPKTEKNIELIKRDFLKKKMADEINKKKAEEIAKKINGQEFLITKRTLDDGTLYGSVSQSDIIKELKNIGYEIDKSAIILDKLIKKVGIYEITIKLYSDIKVKIKIKVVSGDGKK